MLIESMPIRRTALFLVLSGLFALVHQFAVAATLYWYFWWFDILMHFWGGALIVLGVFVFSGFSFSSFKPSLKIVLLTLVLVTVTWEVFEWFVGLYEPVTYLRDTVKDLVVGLGGGLLAYGVLKRYTIK